MRFYYDNKLAFVDKAGKMNFRTTKDFAKKQKEFVKNIQQFHVDSYKKFLDLVERETQSKTEKIYYNMISENHLLLGVKEMDDEVYIKAYYEFENSALKELMLKILDVEEGKNGKALVATYSNHFNYIVSMRILDLLFTHTDVVQKGEKPFEQFKLKAKSGKLRDIIAPHDEIKAVLRELNVFLQNIYDKTNIDFQVAYKRGKSIKDNAAIHKDKEFIFNIDLKDFYPSCKRHLVKKYTGFFFKNAHNAEVIEKMFLDSILINNGLFIGSPISGTLANAIISKPAKYLKNITKNFNMMFSVYADDMTFSSDRFISEEFIINIFNNAFTKYNLDSSFKINAKKSKGMSKQRRRITGVSINDSDQLAVSRQYYRNIRVKVHKLSHGDITVNQQKLRGQIAFACMVDDTGKMFKYLSKFKDTVLKYHLVSEDKYSEMETEYNKNHPQVTVPVVSSDDVLKTTEI